MGVAEGWAEADLSYMREALTLAGEAAQMGEVPVGAVVVQDGEIIGRGHNRSVTDHDPSSHAEVVALREAGRSLGNYRLNEATLYVTLEPCPMCAGALSEARISRVVFGAYDERLGACGSAVDWADTKALNHNVEINGGLLQDECAAVLSEFFEARR